MFRRPLVQTSRLATSSSHHLAFHTSVLCRSQASRQSIARGVRKTHNVEKEERLQDLEKNRPSVVLGTRPGEDAKWQRCLLAQILVNANELVSDTTATRIETSVGAVNMPQNTNFGIREPEEKLLFDDLPLLSSDMPESTLPPNTQEATEEKDYSHRPKADVLKKAAESRETKTRKALGQANALAKVVDLRNANAGGIAYENRKRIIQAFSTAENPYDTGRSEVQAALLTYKIRNLWSHLTVYKKDLGNRRSLRKLVHQRAKILKYLKGVDQNRYEAALHQLALEPESVEGELVV